MQTGAPLSFFMTAGQVSDYTGAAAPLDDMPKAQWLLGDRGYDADWFRDALQAQGIQPCIPGRKSRNEPVRYDSLEFDALWQDNNVVTHGEGVKRIRHPNARLLTMDYSSFAVEGRPELGMIIYNPATPKDAEKLRMLLDAHDD